MISTISANLKAMFTSFCYYNTVKRREIFMKQAVDKCKQKLTYLCYYDIMNVYTKQV